MLGHDCEGLFAIQSVLANMDWRGCEHRVCGCAVIDNLVKGASGQAIQNLNVVMGIPEETGLLQQALFP